MQKDYDLMGQVIGLAMKVHGILGPGFLESVYHQALAHELAKAGVPFESKKRITVWHEEISAGDFEADFLINEEFIVEIKAVQNLTVAHELQTVNYLTATRRDTGLLLNFGSERLSIKRNSENWPNRPKKQHFHSEHSVHSV